MIFIFFFYIRVNNKNTPNSIIFFYTILSLRRAGLLIDTYAVLMNLGEVLGKLMSSGHSVKLKGIGTFYYTCRSEGTGVDTPEEVSPAQITAVQIRFIPEYYRGQCGQVTERTLLSPHIEWVDAEGED